MNNKLKIRSLEFDAPVKQVFRYKNDDIQRDELYLLFVNGNVDKVAKSQKVQPTCKKVFQVKCEVLRDPTVPGDNLAIEHLLEEKDNLEFKGLSVSNGLLAYFDNEGLYKMNV